MQVVIVTGPIDCGKTTYCRNELAGPGSGPPGRRVRGLLLLKVMEREITLGYDAREIGGGRCIPFARRLGKEPPDWEEAERVGCFSISRSGKETANRWIAEGLAAAPEALIIDEVGPLETSGGGLAVSVRRCLAANRHDLTLYLVVRSGWLEEVCVCFALRGARLITLPRPGGGRPSEEAVNLGRGG